MIIDAVQFFVTIAVTLLLVHYDPIERWKDRKPIAYVITMAAMCCAIGLLTGLGAAAWRNRW